MLDAYQPIHGVLLCEGEDISEAFRPPQPDLSRDLLSTIQAAHPGDVVTDVEKDSIEFSLVRRCLARGIPLFGICRGSQIINVVAGGKLLTDIDTFVEHPCKHIDYANYDDHRHPVSVEPHTPLSNWFDNAHELSVNSYHHQGIDKLAPRFVPMAHSPDGLVEGFYDPKHYNPEQGKFVMGLQFHPERMQNTKNALAGEKHIYDYPGCPRPYEAFVRAATVFRSKSTPSVGTQCETGGLASQISVPCAPSAVKTGSKKGLSVRFERSSEELKKEHEGVMKAFDLASRLYHVDENKRDVKSYDGILSRGAAFLEATNPMAMYSKDDLDRLIRSGATVHGTKLVHQLLQEKTNSMNNTGHSPASRQRGSVSEWKRFHKSILQAERALENLRGTAQMKDAISRVQKLSELAMGMSR